MPLILWQHKHYNPSVYLHSVYPRCLGITCIFRRDMFLHHNRVILFLVLQNTWMGSCVLLYRYFNRGCSKELGPIISAQPGNVSCTCTPAVQSWKYTHKTFFTTHSRLAAQGNLSWHFNPYCFRRYRAYGTIGQSIQCFVVHRKTFKKSSSMLVPKKHFIAPTQPPTLHNALGQSKAVLDIVLGYSFTSTYLQVFFKHLHFL